MLNNCALGRPPSTSGRGAGLIWVKHFIASQALAEAVKDNIAFHRIDSSRPGREASCEACFQLEASEPAAKRT
jgi:hypothetical protein